VDVEARIHIDASPERVANFAMEAENDPRWIGGISATRRLTESPTRVGTKVERVASFMKKRITYLMEVVEHAPGERIVMRSIKGPFPMRVTYGFAAREGGTEACIRVEGDPGGFYKLAGPLLGPLVRRSVSRDLRALRRLIELGAA
jgi:uncharacterized membrane protein